MISLNARYYSVVFAHLFVKVLRNFVFWDEKVELAGGESVHVSYSFRSNPGNNFELFV